jgi:hypothetical protein
MLHTAQVLGIAAFILIAASLASDWVRLTTIKQFAQANGLEKIGVNPFSRSVLRLKESLPEGPARNRVKTLDRVSLTCWMASTPLLIASVLYK